MSLRIAVTGARGFVGRALVPALLAEGHQVVTIGRSGRNNVTWDPEQGALNAKALVGVDGVVHLAGASIGQRWTPRHKREILDSRVQGTRLIAHTLARLVPKPRVLLSTSAIGYYGDRGDEQLTEASASGHDFLAGVTRAWEDAAGPARDAGIRVAHPRFALVIGEGGGALAKMVPAFQLGVGGRIGSGTQWMSWVARQDLVRALLFILTRDTFAGPVNVSAPEPVRNVEFTRTLGRVLRRPTPFPVPAFALRLLFGEMADATLLTSQRVRPARLEEAGFAFTYPALEGALRAELGLAQGAVPGRA